MMRYRRNEGFRYSFGKPLPALIIIEEEENKADIPRTEQEASLIDLSPNGMKINTTLNIPNANLQKVRISIRFTLNQTTFLAQGKIVWKKTMGDNCFYGINYYMRKNEQKNLIENLKWFVKSTNKTSVT